MRAAILAAALALAGPAHAASTDWSGDWRAAVRLVTGTDAVGETGSIEAGLEFRYAAGWHGYWRCPGDTGIPPMADWSTSSNVANATLAWPAPRRLVVSGIQNAVYEDRVLLPVVLALAAPRGATRITVSIDHAACSNICVPLHADLSLDLPAGRAVASTEAPAIAAARKRVPRVPAAAEIEVLRHDRERAGPVEMLTIALRSGAGAFESLDMFVEGAGEGLAEKPRVALSDDRRSATLTQRLAGEVQGERPLAVTIVDGDRSVEFVLPPAAPPPP